MKKNQKGFGVVEGLLVLVVISLVGFTGWFVWQTKHKATPQVQTQGNTSQHDNESKSGERVTKIGTVVCLTRKDTSGPQTGSCAIGLKQDDGTSYGLQADDPTTTGSLSGQRVEVTGTLTQQTTQYDSAGLIQVTSIQRL